MNDEQKKRHRERNEAIARLYRSGKTMVQCGALFGIDSEWVRRILVRQGVTQRRFWSKVQPKPTPEERIKIRQLKFWSQAALTADIGNCWIWQGNRDPSGYGRTSWYGKTYYARQIALLISNGEFPLRYILDTCGTRLCVNPHHLTRLASKDRT